MTAEKGNYEPLVQQLRSLPTLRAQVENLENALAALSPEDRIIANLLLINPKRNNIQQACQCLNLEEGAVYYRRNQILQKLQTALKS